MDMQIDLADKTVQRLQTWTDLAHGVTEDVVINQALDCFEQRGKPANGSTRMSADSVIERFRKHRGLLAGVSIDEIVAWRHQGLP